MELFEKPKGLVTRWFSPENPSGEKEQGGLVNRGSKGRAFVTVRAGETATLLNVEESGIVCRIWLTVSDRSPEMLRSLRIDMYWDGALQPAVSAPLGDFFGIGLGQRTPFECALFSDPEGRSFNCFIPMPFWKSARIEITNESKTDLPHLFYDVDVLTGVQHTPESLYFHAHWRRESPNALGKDYAIVPNMFGTGRFLGCNIGVITDPRYETAWWGEGEVKVRYAYDEAASLCGTGTEDYIGTAWGQGKYLHRTQGCSVADSENRRWAFYRYHVDDPVFFERGCEITIQTIGGTSRGKVLAMQAAGIPVIPVTLDSGGGKPMIHLMEQEPPTPLATVGKDEDWCNFWRQDDWSSTAYFYLDSAESVLPTLAAVETRTAGLS